MRRILIIFGIVLPLLLIFTGSALAQDNQPSLPKGNTLTFLPTLKNNEENVLSALPVPEPGWLQFQGPCEQNECPIKYGVRFGDIVVVDIGSEFVLSPGGAVFHPSSKRVDVSMAYYCFAGDDCLPGMTTPKAAAAASTSSWTGSRYSQIDLPPDIDGDLFERIVTWYYKRAIHYDYVSQPADIPVYVFTVRGLAVECDDFVVPSMLDIGMRTMTTVEYIPVGLITCWSNLTQSWTLAFIVEWVSANHNPYTATSELLKFDMGVKRAYLVRIADIKKRQLEVFAHVYNEDIVLIRDIQSMPPAAKRYEFPRWGEIGTALGAGATGIAGGIGWWLGTKALPALDGAMASVMFIVQPETALCPTYDASLFDDIPPQPVCGAVSINQ